MGCARAIHRKPCTTNPIIIMGDEKFVNELCHKFPGIQKDNGNPLLKDDEVWGCADANHIILIEDEEVLYHEWQHHLDARCPIGSEE